jgi:hypothetical protein
METVPPVERSAGAKGRADAVAKVAARLKILEKSILERETVEIVGVVV